jgi:hypothetical protein
MYRLYQYYLKIHLYQNLLKHLKHHLNHLYQLILKNLRFLKKRMTHLNPIVQQNQPFQKYLKMLKNQLNH